MVEKHMNEFENPNQYQVVHPQFPPVFLLSFLLPVHTTGIVTSSQAERSQLQNRVTAMNMLKSKLYELEEEKKAKKRAEIEGEQLDIGWGSQIRSYVFHPYTLVKDNRTGYETHNGQAVMDGDLDPFIDAFLQWKLSQKNPQ